LPSTFHQASVENYQAGFFEPGIAKASGLQPLAALTIHPKMGNIQIDPIRWTPALIPQ
jgi:hypothetical protein